MNSERRITRSCSRLLGRKVVVGLNSQSKQIGRNLFNNQSYEWKARKVLSPVQPSAVTVGGEVKGKSCTKGKENRSDSCKGSKTIKSTYLSGCVNRGGQRGRRNNLFDDEHGRDGKTDDSCKQKEGNVERRITRSVSKTDDSCKKKDGYVERRITLSVSKTDDSCKQKDGNVERRITRSVSKQVGLNCQTMLRRSTRMSSTGSVSYIKTEPRMTIQCGSVLSACVIEDEKKDSKDIKAKEKKSDDCAEVDIQGRRESKLTGVKRRRKQDVLQGNSQGWTKEQEVALHKAYFSAKPSPHFWKKVAKLVPGKSAQECFDKAHSDNQTPLSSKSSSRAKKQNLPSNLVSGSELFKYVETKRKRPCKSKCKSRVARKTVRQLLQKYCHVNQDNEADLFAVLEPSVNYSAEALQLNAVQLTPKQLQRSPDSSKSWDRSSSGRKNHLSRFSNRSASPLTSPPVLKKVKNMALHEKYIDQLHIRENKRTVAFSRCLKSARNQLDRKENSVNSVHVKDIIKAAKDALVFDAKDAIDKFQQSQANTTEGVSDSEEFLYSDNDEDEAVL
ncbi:mis18-binding protein 1-like [Chenopodium quinoa]|uniref:mis18-binding protein 1-like n=1 Tax=Chenopodium quinoa TaxID=63459 RepID=UPI000B76FE99|nr:mis18-binding protein 1-like [Chenopodium quinoa]